MALGRLPLHGGAQHATANASYNIQRTPYDLGQPRPRWALRGRPLPALVRIGQTGSRRPRVLRVLVGQVPRERPGWRVSKPTTRAGGWKLRTRAGGRRGLQGIRRGWLALCGTAQCHLPWTESMYLPKENCATAGTDDNDARSPHSRLAALPQSLSLSASLPLSRRSPT